MPRSRKKKKTKRELDSVSRPCTVSLRCYVCIPSVAAPTVRHPPTRGYIVALLVLYWCCLCGAACVVLAGSGISRPCRETASYSNELMVDELLLQGVRPNSPGALNQTSSLEQHPAESLSGAFRRHLQSVATTLTRRLTLQLYSLIRMMSSASVKRRSRRKWWRR